MAGKVFISCGQADPTEKLFVNKLAQWLKEEKYFNPYAAIDVQTLEDINSSIIRELESSDYFLFIDLKREEITEEKTTIKEYRGSLFSHQELAIAYYLGFERVIFLKHKDVKLEGFFKYIHSNPKEFSNYPEIFSIIEKELEDKKWSPNFSRHLDVRLCPKPSIIFNYEDDSGSRDQYIWHAEIINNNNFKPARNTIAMLWRIEKDSSEFELHDKSPLKWAEQLQEYSAFIPPEDSLKFDLFAINTDELSKVYLHSRKDVYPRLPIISTPGNYKLEYKLFAEGFPPLNFCIELTLTGNWESTQARICSN